MKPAFTFDGLWAGARSGGFLFALVVGAALLIARPAHAQGNPGDSVLSGIQIHKINFVFPQAWNGEPGDTASWTTVRNTMRDNKEQEIYIPAKLEINCDETRANPGCVLMDSVGVRYKGNSTFSRSREKNPFRVSFDEYGIDQRWNGVKGFTLNNANMDPSHMAEKIHMDFAVERAGMPGPRFAYAHVFVNGFPYSFYLLGELADGRLLNTNFGENDGDLFKAIDGLSNNSDFSNASFTNKRYENKSDSVERAWTRLGLVIEAVNGANPAEDMPARINLNSVYRGMGADILFSSMDSYIGVGQNYQVYFPEAEGSRMEWILWDASLSFGKMTAFGGGFGGGGGGSQGTACTNTATNPITCGQSSKPLAYKIMSTESLKQDYLRALWFLYKAYFEGPWLNDRIDSVATVIRPYLEADPHKLGVTNMSVFDNNVNTLKTFVTNRQGSVNDQFTAQGITPSTAIRATDMVVNEVAPAQGWIELYNNRDYAIDLSGHSLTNDPAQPNKWTFPPASFVAPRSHLKVRLQGGAGTDTATNFSLAATGGFVRLSRADGTGLDSLTFGAQYAEQTFARSTDGAGVFVASAPTPGAANIPVDGLPANITPGAVRINEFMADNATIASPAGNKADWIELYNTSSTPISLAGLYFSDNATNASKWQFPEATSIPANGYLVVWAYDTTFAGSLYASWALNKDGEHIRLSNADLSVVDSVTFGEQAKSRTMARIPNGTGAFASSCSPTLGMANTCVVTGVAGGVRAPDEGLALVRGAGRIAARFTMKEAGLARLSVLDARGREVALLVNKRLVAGMHEGLFEAGSVPSGTYWFRLRAGGVEQVRAAVILR